jgi:serine protease Do
MHILSRCRPVAGLILSAAFLFFVFIQLANGQAIKDNANPSIYEKAKPALVEIIVNGHNNGSGWFIDPKGVLFTAAHVIEQPGQKVEVTSPAIGRLEAEVLAMDLGHDLALLRVQARDEPYPIIALADKAPAPGEEVFLFGSPLYRHAVLLRGSAARDDTTFEYYLDHYLEITHISATVPLGMSGGPWLNSQGKVVGLNSGVMAINENPTGVAFSISLPHLRSMLQNRKTASTPAFGAALEELWQQDSKTIDRFPPQAEGLIVKILQNDGPASRSDVKQWDMIVAADGIKVRLVDEFLRIVAKKQPGETLELSLLSADGAGERKVAITLGKLEVGWPSKGR